MPTMMSKKLSDLEAERQSFLLHEQRIIRERDEILNNLRNHLDQLDLEIVRLGGTARRALPNSGLTHSSSVDLDGFTPSIAPFPSVRIDSNETKKRPRGRPRKSVEGADPHVGKSAGSHRKKRERSPMRGEASPSRASMQEKKGAPSNIALPNGNKQISSGNDDADNKAPSNSDSHSAQVSKRFKIEDSATMGSFIGSWTCECGESYPGTRARCGKCRRWRGGRRQTRWTIGSATKKKAIDVYRDLASARPMAIPAAGDCSIVKELCDDSAAAAGALLGLSKDGTKLLSTNNKDPRSEVKEIMGRMVSALVNIHQGPGKTKKKKASLNGGLATGVSSKVNAEGIGAMKETASGGDALKVEAPKRKRGRPRKDQGCQRIHRVVSTSDSDSGSTGTGAAPRKPGRPCKEPTEDGSVHIGGRASGDGSKDAEENSKAEQSEATNGSVESARNVAGGFVQSLFGSAVEQT